jgi:hypothetical protein
MNAPVFTPLKTRLNPLNLFAVVKDGTVCGSEAISRDVTPTRATVGIQCLPLVICPGNIQISF